MSRARFASTHKPAIRPSELVHAEQQVLDWLAWLDRNNAYARESLPGVQRSVGFVVIGSHDSLSDDGKNRLARRNLAFRGSLQILTYEDLRDRAVVLLEILVASPERSGEGEPTTS